MPDMNIAPERRPTEIAPTELPGLHALLFATVSVVVVAEPYLGRPVLIPTTIAMLPSFLLAPLVNLLRRLWLGRVPSVLLAVLFALAVILAA
jgi:predicted PurR-regulated permease PerM